MHDRSDPPAVTDLVRALAEQLEAAGEDAAIVIVGGAALLMHGWINRATRDVDVIATGTPASGPHPATVAPPDPLPPALVAAARKVARDFGDVRGCGPRPPQPALPGSARAPAHAG